MNNPTTSTQNPDAAQHAEVMSAIFAHMVLQQSNMAMMLLGKVAHPQTGEALHDLDGAKMFIDQLEMLENKTRGNLSKEEEQLLKQSLMSLRMAFVEAVSGETKSQPPEQKSEPAAPAAAPGTAASTISSGEEEEHRKKFSKKY